MEHVSEVLSNLKRGTPTQDQKTYKKPEPTLEEKREQLRKSLGVSSLDSTFENFRPVKGTRKALAAFKSLAKGKTDRPLLLCYGGVGNGKTHLCEAAAITLYKRGIFCRVMAMAAIMRVLKDCMGPDPRTSFDVVLARYCRCQHLIIDEVGMGGSGSTWEWGQLEEIMVVRYRERLFTILASNLEIKQDEENPNIAFIPERIVSRFSDPEVGMVVLNEGEDYRRLKSGQR